MDLFDLYAKIDVDLNGYYNSLKRAIAAAQGAAGNISSSFRAIDTQTMSTQSATDRYNDELANTVAESSKAEKASGRFGESLKDVGSKALDAASKVGEVIAGIGKAASVSIGAAGAALTKLTKQSLDAVATYEQMEGGVKKIFGDSASKVLDFANEAYSKAGLSANEYMESVTNFSASLIQSLEGDTSTAADLANTAIQDMADNANTFGTAMDSIQAAYQGFAKQNYTMLDNLKLGYGGTAKEMARLLNESGVLGDNLINLDDTKKLTESINEAGFSKIIEAIHKVQENLNITGTTSKEAAGTISGSVSSMKAAWQNFLTGVGTPEQFSKVLSTSISNIRENLKDIIPRLTEGLTELADLLAPEIPPLIEETLPAIIEGSSLLLTGLADRLPDLLTAILPSLSTGVVNVSVALVEALPQLVSSLKDSIPIVVDTIMEKKDDLLKAGKDIIACIFPKGVESVTEITETGTAVVMHLASVLTNPENTKKVMDKGFAIIGAMIDGLLSQESLDAIFDEENGVGKVITNIIDGIAYFITNIEDAATNIIEKLGNYLADEKNRQKIWDSAREILRHLGEGLINSVDNIAPFMVELARAWAEMFIGDIDYTETASEIIRRLGAAFVQNLKSGGLLGKYLRDEGLLEVNEQQDYLDSDFMGNYDDWKELNQEEKAAHLAPKQSTYDAAYGMRNSSIIPDIAKEQMRKAGIQGYATGFVADRPTWLSGNVQVGENGTEALLPLENNTDWMDMFADKLGNKMNDTGVTNTIVIESIVIQAPTGDADDIADSFVETLDEKIRDLQITKNRGIGDVEWKQ